MKINLEEFCEFSENLIPTTSMASTSTTDNVNSTTILLNEIPSNINVDEVNFMLDNEEWIDHFGNDNTESEGI